VGEGKRAFSQVNAPKESPEVGGRTAEKGGGRQTKKNKKYRKEKN